MPTSGIHRNSGMLAEALSDLDATLRFVWFTQKSEKNPSKTPHFHKPHQLLGNDP